MQQYLAYSKDRRVSYCSCLIFVFFFFLAMLCGMWDLGKSHKISFFLGVLLDMCSGGPPLHQSPSNSASQVSISISEPLTCSPGMTSLRLSQHLPPIIQRPGKCPHCWTVAWGRRQGGWCVFQGSQVAPLEAAKGMHVGVCHTPEFRPWLCQTLSL